MGPIGRLKIDDYCSDRKALPCPALPSFNSIRDITSDDVAVGNSTIDGHSRIDSGEHGLHSHEMVADQGKSGHRREVVVELLDDQFAHERIVQQPRAKTHPQGAPHTTPQCTEEPRKCCVFGDRG